MALFILVLSTFFVVNSIVVTGHEVRPVSPAIPKIELSADPSIDEIIENGKETRYEGAVFFVNEDLYKDVEVKGRGNSTLHSEKMPFQIKFSEKIDLYGMGKSKKWILLANYYDSTQVRNSVAFYIERLLGEQYALNGKFVELYYNNENLGLYYLTPKVEIGKARVDLRDPLGVIAEYDSVHNENKKCYAPKSGGCITVSDLVSKDNESVAMADFMKSFDNLMSAAKRGDYSNVSKLADVESLAIYYILSEFSVNPDAYISSFYFYKDGPEDKIHAGPGWDFDFAFGNRRWSYAKEDEFFSPSFKQFQRRWAFGGSEYFDKVSGTTRVMESDDAISKLLYYMIDMPEFLSQVKTIYREKLMGKKDEIIGLIKDEVAMIKDYALRDNSRLQFDDFYTELDELMIWITERFKHFDTEYGA